MALLDYIVLGVYVAATLVVGLLAGRGERNTDDYFLGGRRQHWLLVGLSIVATEASALTFLIVPGRSFAQDFWYLQLYAGAFVGRLLIAYLLLPAFFGGSVTTVYEYLGQRFGPATRMTAATFFLVSRVLGSGIRLLAASVAIAVIFEWDVVWVMVGAAAVAIAYTTFGGIKAIIWTDALQALVFIGAAVAVIVYLFVQIPGNWTSNLDDARAAGKFKTFYGSGSWNADRLFWVLFIHAIVQNMAALGVDQDLTQRMLTCPDLRRGQRALIFNAVLGFPIVVLFLLIGALMYVFYQAQPGAAYEQAAGISIDHVFAHFIASDVHSSFGLKGLLIAGIFAAAMSSLDSALGALSSTAVTDYYRPWVRPLAPPEHYLKVARLFNVGFGVLLVLVALAFRGADDLLTAAFGAASLLLGPMLGVFLLGTLTRRGSDRINMLAMAVSVCLLLVIRFGINSYSQWHVAWPWWIVIGTSCTLLVGVVRSPRGD